jgi:two-component system, OmpR family, catabolic regulation response regulator CreB
MGKVYRPHVESRKVWTRPKILIVEDEPGIAENLLYALETDGCDPVWVETGQAALKVLSEQSVDLISLDIGLPDGNGRELCREIRRRSSVPIIFATCRGSEEELVKGLEAGGDDYIRKPVQPREFVARVRAVLRRCERWAEPPEHAEHGSEVPPGPLQVDEARRTIFFFGKALNLSPCEFEILARLAAEPGRVFTRQQLMTDPFSTQERTVNSHIKTLRAKLRQVRPEINAIETRRGFGYALRESW